MTSEIIKLFVYIIATVFFALGLKMLSSPQTARKGNLVSAIGMLLAVVATLFSRGLHFQWIAAGIIMGSLIGSFAAYRIPMTSIPQMVALLNGFGGLASLLVAWATYQINFSISPFVSVPILLSVLIGGITFTGSVIAWAKLQGVMNSKPLLFKGQQIINGFLLLAVIVFGIIFCQNPSEHYFYFLAIIVMSLTFGILSVIPIGGADMPVVISLLNSYSGMAACATGFVIMNKMLIVTGSLVGASGLILTNIMCKAMNRSLANVLFSGFGSSILKKGSSYQGEVKPINVGDAYFILEAARSVVFVPGYGLAVAQAQHVVKELADILEKNGTDVSYAIHPVAGRMPGHMNVLLAEANIPYDQLKEMDTINPVMNTIDVAIVIGANDVVNPAARKDTSSPIRGMPIINVDKAKTVFVLKRSMATGFAGIPNELFSYANTRMIFGDAKKSISRLVAEFKEGH